jgi:NAD dependent epimerase/dehydratase family enzyme
VLLEGQRVLPAKLMAEAFTFRFPAIDQAIADLLGAA